MKKIDEWSWDQRLLQLLVTVVEAGSITGAAQRLGVTQSAVSHQLDKLRVITGDPLFVKSGRGIVATARAEALAPRARELLRELAQFTQSEAFDPARWRATLTIAANDFQRDLLLPALALRLRQWAPQVVLRVVHSAVPRLDMLRADACQLVISPRPPDGSDIVQKRLFEDRYRVFYDPAVRAAPRHRADYLAADHATVVHEPQRSLDIDRHLAAQGVQRRFVVMAPGFSALPAFIFGTPLLATAPSLLALHAWGGLAHIKPPVNCPSMPMYLIWHQRYSQDPAHRWLRAQIDEVVAQARRAGRLGQVKDGEPLARTSASLSS